MIEMTDSQALHRTVLLTEAADEVSRAHNGIFIDATFGRGGHSRAVLSRIAPDARLIAFDRDPEAIRAAAAIDDPRFSIVHAPFSEMKEKLAELGVTQVNGILMDIGVSSPQIDEADRGFSFRMDGPLDMRMDTTCGLTAAQWLAQASEPDIARVLRDYGEERFSAKIARAICRTREEIPIERTAQLADLIARTVPKNKNDSAQHPATRSFQAIRIQVNGELDELKRALSAAGSLLAPDGVLAVISFHSLEDRIVKRFLDAGAHPDKAVDSRIALPADAFAPALWTDLRRIKPSVEECEANPRARSAVLRTAQRTEVSGASPQRTPTNAREGADDSLAHLGVYFGAFPFCGGARFGDRFDSERGRFGDDAIPRASAFRGNRARQRYGQEIGR